MRYSIDNKKELLRKFELYRLDNSLSVREISNIIKVNPGTVTRWEDGKQLPHKVQCYQIEKLLKDFKPTIE